MQREHPEKKAYGPGRKTLQSGGDIWNLAGGEAGLGTRVEGGRLGWAKHGSLDAPLRHLGHPRGFCTMWSSSEVAGCWFWGQIVV